MTSQESNIASKRLLLIFRVMLEKVSTPIYAFVSWRSNNYPFPLSIDSVVTVSNIEYSVIN
jgi:hypothetical protein